MTQKIYHGDPNREHRFWVYPTYKLLQNAQWDAYDPFNLCDNFTLLDPSHCTDTPMYQCNGHPIESNGDAECWCSCSLENVTMVDKFHHGDPSREHHFWVYPKHKLLQNSQWDAYDPFNLCDNFTLLDPSHCTDTKMYQCNGHPIECHCAAECSWPYFDENADTPDKVYHGDPSREHHFWIYPKNKPLIDPQYEAYDPTHLCNNFSIVAVNQFTNLRIYRCNGHPKGSDSDAECSHHDFHETVTTSHKVYHGDPTREHHFWVYPPNNQLINPQWDAYDPTNLCDNFTLLDVDRSTYLRTYKCNGH